MERKSHDRYSQSLREIKRNLLEVKFRGKFELNGREKLNTTGLMFSGQTGGLNSLRTGFQAQFSISKLQPSVTETQASRDLVLLLKKCRLFTRLA